MGDGALYVSILVVEMINVVGNGVIVIVLAEMEGLDAEAVAVSDGSADSE